MRVIKFETKWMPFLSDVFALVIVIIVYASFKWSHGVSELWVRKCGFQIYFVNDMWNKSYMNCGKWNENEEMIVAVNAIYAHLVEHCTGKSPGHGFKPDWSPKFFSGFFTQLHKLRSLRRSFLHFQNIFCRDVNERPRHYVSQCETLHAFSLQNSVVSKFIRASYCALPNGWENMFFLISSGP